MAAQYCSTRKRSGGGVAAAQECANYAPPPHCRGSAPCSERGCAGSRSRWRCRGFRVPRGRRRSTEPLLPAPTPTAHDSGIAFPQGSDSNRFTRPSSRIFIRNTSKYTIAYTGSSGRFCHAVTSASAASVTTGLALGGSALVSRLADYAPK